MAMKRYLFSVLLSLPVFWIGIDSQSFNPLPLSQRRAQPSAVVLPRSFTPNAVRDAFARAGERVSERRRIVPRRGARPLSVATRRHHMFLASRARSRVLESTQERFEEATRILLNELNLTPEQISVGLAQADLPAMLEDNTVQECEALFTVPTCQDSRYRTFDGTCNNRRNPTWGMAGVCFERLLDPAYADGTAEPRVSVSGRPLPRPRTISLEIHAHLDNPTDYVTHMFMQWGQFLDHDISLSPLSRDANNQLLSCCPDDGGTPEENTPEQCDPILIDSNDPFFSTFGIRCLNNVRTVICSTCSLGPRQQTNQLTAFIDASHVYGLSTNDSRALRNMDGSGTLQSQLDSDSRELLPQSADPANDPCSSQNANLNCFRSGDQRVNQHPALTSLHVMFLREHNRVARRLREINPRWDEERLYQEARRIVGASMQVITYRDFLPLVIGPERMEYFDLSTRSSGFTQYDETVQPTLANEFSTAAYRFGHSMVNSFFPELTSEANSGNRLRDIFLFPFGLYSGQAERIILGLTQSPSQKFDRYMVRDVTNHLYQQRGNQTGLDLASLNVHRGRDHGIPGYVNYVRFCGGPEINSFRDLDRLFQRGVRPLFERLYQSVEDIDLFSGGLAERPNQGAVIGPTFTCIIGIQFYHLKYGDRFYFEHAGQSGSFTIAQLNEIRKISLGKILCDNSNIDRIQQNVFLYQSNRNEVRRCNELPEMDLSQWRE